MTIECFYYLLYYLIVHIDVCRLEYYIEKGKMKYPPRIKDNCVNKCDLQEKQKQCTSYIPFFKNKEKST